MESSLGLAEASNKTLKDLLLHVGNEEILIERLRQQLCKMEDFDAYTAFMRIDRKGHGKLDKYALEQFMIGN